MNCVCRDLAVRAAASGATSNTCFLRLGVALPIAVLCVTGSAVAAGYPGGLTSHFIGIHPATPLAGQSISLLVQSGPCEFLSDESNSASIIAISNNVVSVRIPGVSTSICDLGFSPREYVLPGLSAGNYRVDLTFYDIEQPGDIGEPAGYIGGRDIVVLPVHAPRTIPANDLSALLALGALLAFWGFRAVTSVSMNESNSRDAIRLPFGAVDSTESPP